MSTNLGVNTNSTATYEKSFFDQARRDLKEIENKGVSKLETLEDLRDTKGKSFRTADIEKLMQKYDPDAYEKYSKLAYTVDGGHTQSGLSYLSRWMDDVKAELGKKQPVSKQNDISAKNEEKLSKKAQDFLKNLREKYGDYDFMVGNRTDDLMALSKSGCKEFSVIFSNAEIERMANDEKYAEEKMQGVAGSVKMARRIAEEYGFGSAFDKDSAQNGVINKISVVVNDDGSMKLFAELEKSTAKQRERIDKAREAKAEEKKNSDRTKRKNLYEKEEKPSVKRTTIEATSEEELMDKIQKIDWEKIGNSYSGDRVNYTV